ncbi:geranylgeranyl pyrophosphate synthetase [Friedmanniomyces endolithicus]|nr:geranylgeranyl pyrophosphate synthetase [Friedmanniomyces endolithicus]KAK0363727.1 geranylgeranyl pyrophosphate synthetase [Friedmanniomyces endolithicus]KAK0785484.1 geranylgeranyl pyrophosphate synthetase [Friedmanniomyces endolithicus]KAK0790199.1 geranylgeranyl pyrophosphate synthetase [Friedmanniomyces endolithicus]KAK0808609.1 geranylgeranyl pyrophosphate synthetase [Friedmanniomyces endolithicus]
MSAPTASTSTTFTSRTSSTFPARISQDTAETEDFDPGYELASFDAERSNPSRPSTAGGKQTPDSPTLGSAQVSPVIAGKADRGLGQSDSEGERRRRSRFMEEMGSPTTITDTMERPYSRPSSEQQAGAGASGKSAAAAASPSSPSTSHTVDPATIPIRTSSSNAVSNGEKQSNWRDSSSIPTSPTKKKHRSLMDIPEDRRRQSRRSVAGPSTSATDEHDWLAQTHRHSTSASNAQPHDRDRFNHASTSPPQPTFNPSSSPPTNNHFPPLHPSSTTAPLPPSTPTTWSQEKESILRAPYTYLEAHPGKDLRTHLITAFNAWLRVPEPSLAIITKVVGMLHTASLLIDDVEDSSVLRRGVPVAHKIFGAAQTINCANYMYFCALKELAGLKGVPGGGGGDGRETAVGIYEEELLNLHRGQGMDLFWRDTLTCPSEDDYLEMVGNKTGGLFRLAVRLMCSESPSHNARPTTSSSSGLEANGAGDNSHSDSNGKDGKTDYIPLVNTIGLLFQILDDYLNLASPVYTSHKGLCEDLTEGKFSFPIIHSIRSDPSNLTLINILKQRTEDEDVKRWAVGYMEGTTGSFAYTRRVLRGLNRRAVGLVGEVDEGVARRGGGGGGGEMGEGKGLGDGVRRILEGLAVEGQRGSRGGV